MSVAGREPGRWGRARLLLAGLDAFAAVTAVAGGIALVAGFEASRFPADWLRGTPFSSYVLPGVLLAAVVGGSALVATIEVVRSRLAGGRASMAAGVILLGWIVGEVAILTEDATVISPTEALYLVLGLAMAALGARVAGSAARA